MFISYIIPPFQSDAYLVRCIESLYGQTSDDFEVIVAEYEFTGSKEHIRNSLDTRKNFKTISECRPEEKLRAAVRMIDPSAEFVQFVDADTVVAPHALETIRNAVQKDGGTAELVIPGTVVKTGGSFVRRFRHGWEESGEKGALDALDYCFRKSLFDRYAEAITTDLYHVETLMDVLLCSGTSLVFAEAVCYYITKPGFYVPVIAAEDYEKLHVISANICKEEMGSVKVKLFTKYVHRLTKILDSEQSEYTDQLKAYETLKVFGADTSGNLVLSKIFTINTGIPAADMQNLDLSGYQTLRRELFRLSDTECSVALITDIFNDYNNKHSDGALRLERWIKNYNDERKAIEEENKKMREDIAALTANMHLLMQRIENGNFGTGSNASVSSFHDPASEVPYLFATGRLGMTTVFRSIRGWFRFKFSRKK